MPNVPKPNLDAMRMFGFVVMLFGLFLVWLEAFQNFPLPAVAGTPFSHVVLLSGFGWTSGGAVIAGIKRHVPSSE